MSQAGKLAIEMGFCFEFNYVKDVLYCKIYYRDREKNNFREIQ